MKFIAILLLFSLSLSSQHLSWERHRSLLPHKLFSFDADSIGNYFYTLDASQVVVHGNIFSKEERVYPRIKDIRFNPNKHHVEVFIDKGQRPIVEHTSSIYQFENNHFILDTIRKASWNYEQLKYDENGVLYKIDYKYIRKCENGLYSSISYPLAEFSDWIQAVFLFNTDSNYLVIGEYDSGKADIVQLNTETGQYRELVQINAPMPIVSHSILYKDGKFIIPTARDIIFYKDFGKTYESPLIDTAEQNRGIITALAAAKINGEILVRKGSKFYFSYDGLKTWIPAQAMNIGFPKGPISELVVWDSLHAAAVVADDCGHERLYVFNSPEFGWQEVHHPDHDNSNYFSINIDENQQMIAQVGTCGWFHKNPEDSVWMPIYTPASGSDLYEGYLRNYLITERKDFAYDFRTLYSTDDWGKTWDSIWTFSEGITGLNYFGNGHILVSVGYNGSGFFISRDYGLNFNFAGSTGDPNFPINNLKLDHNGVVVAVNRNGINNNFYYLDENTKSWKVDRRFINLNCRAFEFTEEGKYFLDIEYKGQRGIYSTFDFVNFYSVTEKLGYTFAYTFKYLGNHEVVINCYNHDGVRGVYFSKDGGTTLEDLTLNLPYMRDEIQYGTVSGFMLDKNRQLYLMMQSNGLFKLSRPLDPVKVNDQIKSTDGVHIYPQPVCSMLSFSMNIPGDKFDCRVLNLMGQVVLNPVIDNMKMSVSELGPGIYYLQLCTSDGRCWIEKFVKN